MLGREIAGAAEREAGGAAEREAANVGDVGAHAGGAAGGELLRISIRGSSPGGTAVRRRRQILRMVGQPETGHRRRVAVLRGCIAMHDAHLAVAVAVRR